MDETNSLPSMVGKKRTHFKFERYWSLLTPTFSFFKMAKKYIIDNEDKKKKILFVLSKYGRMPTTKLCFIGFEHTDYQPLFLVLEELVKDKKIIKQEETNAIYWSIK